MKLSRNYLFVLIIFLFIIDVISYLSFESYLACSLIALYSLILFHDDNKFIAFGCIALFLGLEDFMVYGRFALQACYLIPLTALVLRLQRSLYIHQSHPYLVATTCIVFQIFFIEYWALCWPISYPYTIKRVSVILLVTLLVSLMLRIGGRQDNRLSALKA